MRTIGVLGGMTWHSSIEYYRLINTLANERLGGIHTPRCVLVSVDMGAVDELMAAGRWEEAGTLLAADAQAVERAGAEVFILGCNTLHNVWDTIVEGLEIPSIHIGDATGARLAGDGHERVALLGTRYTMELPFLRGRLEDAFGIGVVVPDEADRDLLNRTVFEEFSRGVFSEATRSYYVDLIEQLAGNGVSAVVLGCTEIGLLLQPGDVDVPLYDTAHLHAAAVVDYAT
jgi:aspartate racemase